MKLDESIKVVSDLAKPYRITEGDTFRLKDIDPDDTAWMEEEDKLRARRAYRAMCRPWPRCRTCVDGAQAICGQWPDAPRAARQSPDGAPLSPPGSTTTPRARAPAVLHRKAVWCHGDRVEVVPVARAPALYAFSWRVYTSCLMSVSTCHTLTRPCSGGKASST